MSNTTLNSSEFDQFSKLMSEYLSDKLAISLSTLLGHPVEHRVRRILSLDLSEIENIIPPYEDLVTLNAVYIQCQGDLHLEMLFSFLNKDAKKISSILLDKPITRLTSLERSTLTEIGNILAGSLLNSISDSKDLKIDSSVPGYAKETFRGLLDTLLVNFAAVSENIILLDTDFHCPDINAGINIQIFVDPLEAKKLIKQCD